MLSLKFNRYSPFTNFVLFIPVHFNQLNQINNRLDKINCLSLDLSQIYFDFKANDYFDGKYLKLPVVRKTQE